MKQTIVKFNVENIHNMIEYLNIEKSLEAILLTLKSDVCIIEYLQQQQHYKQAVLLLALGLPKRESIWWAYRCSLLSEKNKDCLITQEALAVVKSWVHDPDDNKRRRAGRLGKKLEYYTPASWAATAVFWSGGNIENDDRPEVEADDSMCAEAVSNAIAISAHKADMDINDAFQLFLTQGLHIGMGGNGGDGLT